MQEFEHTSRDDRTYTEEELACPYFDECYIQVRYHSVISGDSRASLTIDLSNAKYLKED